MPTILRLPWFVHMPFSCPKIPSRIPLSYHVSLGLSWFWQFLRVSLVWMTLTVWRGTAHSCRLSLYGICRLLSSWLDWGYGVWGERAQRSSAIFASSSIRVRTINMTADLVTWLGGDCQISPWQFPFLLLSTLFSWKGVTLHSPHLRRGSFSPPPQGQVIYLEIRWNYLELFIQNNHPKIIWNSSLQEICLFSLIYLLIQSFIYIRMDSWILTVYFGL